MSALRTERLLNLLTLLLNSRRPIALREIREMDEFTAYHTQDPKSGERAFERDKAALLELGIPLRWVVHEQDGEDEGGGGYVIDKSRYFLPQLQLSASEMALLTIAGAAAATLSGFAGKAAVIRALAKLGFDAVEQAGHAPLALAHTPLVAGADAAHVGNMLESLHNAMALAQRVQFTYATHAAAPRQRQVDSYGLYYRQGHWYLVGFCQLRQAIRTFQLARLHALQVLRPKAAYSVPTDFRLKDYVQRRSWEFPGGPPTPVLLRLAARLRPAQREILGEHVQVLSSPDASGDVMLRLQATSLDALVPVVLPYGDALEVLQPAPLRARLALLHRNLAARYSVASRPLSSA